jgi:branched-chain amino acid transport system ATP-binding protein
MSNALLEVTGLGKRFGGFVALSDVELQVAKGERLGLIGPNGSGKSTLVNCLCGTLRNDTGQVTFRGQGLNGLSAYVRTRRGIARSFQLPRPFWSLTLADNVLIPILYAADIKVDRVVTDSRLRCDELLDMVGLLSKADHKPSDLTQIEMRKLELARAMASEPLLLIVDEVMAGLSHQEVDDVLALLMKLSAKGVTIVMIEHIIRAVLTFSQRLVVLVAGRKIADGNPQKVIRQPDVVMAYLGS